MRRIAYFLPLSALLLALLQTANGGQNVQATYFLNVTFQCDNGITTPGYSVYVVGDKPEIGSWDPANAVLLKPSAYPKWTGRVKFSNVKLGDQVKWKCVIRNENTPYDVQKWQPGADNQVTLAWSPEPQSIGTF
ncbi:MAG: carbohydrate-binding module family 20 domain-containing protein [Pseudomonas sp.]|uniref:carbohydrate-binding module family 20 domain-containing protein n=1 Tax=Pseudomonas sp. TaxID=306 RepID=UPI003C753C97